MIPAATIPAASTYRVVHVTDYRYSEPMIDGFTVAHLTPRFTDRQNVRSSLLTFDPVPDEFDQFQDMFGNITTLLAVHQPHSSLAITAESLVSISPPPEPPPGPAWEDVASIIRASRGDQALSVSPFATPTLATPPLAVLGELTAAVFTARRPIVESVRELMSMIFHRFVFDPSFSDVATPIVDVLHARRGVCQDFAHIGLAALRSVGLAGRYVSGYIETTPPPGQVKLIGADASHAWCSVWVPGFGWVDFDPTNDCMPVDRHITIGWGRDYGDITPARGVVIGPPSTQTLWVSVDVSRQADDSIVGDV